MLLKLAAHDYIKRHRGPEDVFLLIEVADSTVAYDRNQKLPAYGRAGIPEVWLINLPERSIEVYRQPHYLGYASKQDLREGSSACPHAFPEAEIDVQELLRQAS
jgi:Uma2 family endonuclease